MAVTLNANTSTGFIATSDTSGVLQLQTGGTTAVTVDASQNVGIGTASPGSRLTVSGGDMQVNGGRNLLFGDSTNGYYPYVGSPAANVIAFFSTSAVERMRIDSAGNVGIGTTSPANKLTSIIAGSNAAATDYILSGGSATYQMLGIGEYTAANAIVIANKYSGGGNITFRTGSATPAEVMRIDTSGNLLVGTTSGASFRQRLYCNGFTNNGIVIATTDNASGFIYASFKDQTDTTIGSITRVGTTSVVSYATSSDYRLKDNIAPMTGALAKVAALKPVTYKWKADGSDSQGFIAHELQAVVPECVTGEKDAVDADGNPVYQGIDTSFLVATLTAALQELKALVDTQASTITALQADVEALKGTA